MRDFAVNSEPHAGARPLVRLCVALTKYLQLEASQKAPLTCKPKINLGEVVVNFSEMLGVIDLKRVLLAFSSSNWELLIHR